MPDGSIDDLGGNIARTFRDLKKEFKLLDDDEGLEEPYTDTEWDEAEARVTPPEPVASTPPAPVVPPAPSVVEVVPEEDETYPGSRHTRRGLAETSEADEETEIVWDDHPRTYNVGGEDVEFFTISALARALGNRKPGTLRKWEDKGWIPPARYRSPGEEKRNRLYTRPQIEGMVAIAREEGLMDPAKKLRIDQTKFPERVRRLFAALEQRN